MKREDVIRMHDEAGKMALDHFKDMFGISIDEVRAMHKIFFGRLIASHVKEECAKVCDAYADDKWSLYKGRAPYIGTEDGRANPDVQGRSDGAEECAAAIRALDI